MAATTATADVKRGLDSKQWAEFMEFAVPFYTDCFKIATTVAGIENAGTSQILIAKISPDLLQLFHEWKYLRSLV